MRTILQQYQVKSHVCKVGFVGNTKKTTHTRRIFPGSTFVPYDELLQAPHGMHTCTRNLCELFCVTLECFAFFVVANFYLVQKISPR